jgi:hypothetical protein
MGNNKHTQLVDFSNPNADKITSGSTKTMTNNKQQTAVELLAKLLLEKLEIKGDGYGINQIINLSKAMEKQMTIKLYNDYENYLEETFKNQCGGQAVVLSFEEFYEQTYGDDKQ